MRKYSTYIAIGVAAACFGTAASAQDSGMFSGLGAASAALAEQAPAEFRVAPVVAPSPLTLASQSAPVVAPTGAMTAPMAPGSGATVDVAMTPDVAFVVQGTPPGQEAPGGFTTASGDDVQPEGIAPMLGLRSDSGLAATFTPDASLVPSVTLGR